MKRKRLWKHDLTGDRVTWPRFPGKGWKEVKIHIYAKVYNMGFKLNDMVAWSSQSGGSRLKQKVGRVVQVVQPNVAPDPGTLRVLGSGFGMPRIQESYLVQVGNVAYWPLVRNLRSTTRGK